MSEQIYRPVRIIQPFSVTSKNLSEMQIKYPHAKVENIKKISGNRTSSVTGIYASSSIIDAPTDAERKMFDSMPSNEKGPHTIDIPLSENGLDDPMSGIGRTTAKAIQGKERWRRIIAKRK